MKNKLDSTHLVKKITDRSARIGVVGMGYVGLPFAVEKVKAGFEVLGIERNPDRVERLNSGDSYISDVSNEELGKVVQTGRFKAVTSFEEAGDLDVIVIAVPTPLTKNLTPELKYVRSVTKGIAKILRKNQLVCLESTTYPGTTEEVIVPILEGNTGMKADEDFFVAHSPERVDPGNKRYTTKNTNKVVGGVGPNSLECSQVFYQQTIDKVVPVSSAKAAELVKIFENTYRAVNIALVNELTLLCDKMDLNVWEVLEAAFTKPFGIQPFFPGPGVGGHCIPIDPHYLEWKAKEHNFETHFIALAGEINRRMPEFVLEKARRLLNEQGVSMSKAKILIMGVAYKADLSDYRESPALDVVKLLQNDKANLSYHDPFVPEITVGDKTFNSVEFSPEVLREFDLVILTTGHSETDYKTLVDESRAILDTRNATKDYYNPEKVTLL